MPSVPRTTTYTTSSIAIRLSTKCCKVPRSSAMSAPYRNWPLLTTLVSRMDPTWRKWSASRARRPSMKYQLNAEQVRIKMIAKKTMNFVRRLTNRRPTPKGPAAVGGPCSLLMVGWVSIGFIDKPIQFLRDRHSQESGCLQIDADLQPLDRHRLLQSRPISVQHASGELARLPPDFFVAD